MTLLIVLHVLICVFLVCVILLQPGKSDGGIGFGSSSQSIFGSRGAGNFLTKTTSVCAVLFLFTSFIMTRTRIKEFSGSVIKADAASSAPAPTKAGEPGKVETKGLEDAIKGAGQPAKTETPPASDAKVPPPAETKK